MSRPSNDKTLIVVAGPTASGKTAMAIELAKYFHCEIISADSRQIFREISIGTAKPLEHELQQVHHHFINSHSITEEYDAAAFGDEAIECAEKLFLTMRHVVVTGGSGLYIKAMLEGFDDIPEIDPAVRDNLQLQYSEYGVKRLQEMMLELDPDQLSKMDPNNPQRLMRALEVRLGTGFSIGSFQQRKRKVLPFNVIKIGLQLGREELYQRINARVDAMVERGLFEEAESLYHFKGLNALQTVGYQEIFDYMDGLCSRAEAIDLLKRNTRRYAKRQLTWFKRDPEITWVHPDNLAEIIRWIENPDNRIEH